MPKKSTPESLAKGDSENCFEVVDGLVGAENLDRLHSHCRGGLEIDSEII